MQYATVDGGCSEKSGSNMSQARGKEKCISDFVSKPEGMRQFETLRHRWEGNIKKDLKKGMDWNHLALDRDRWFSLVNMVMGFFCYFNQQMHTIVIVMFFKTPNPYNFRTLRAHRQGVY